ncbi:protein kinase [bacterium]|nr:protein kinase [bacterium]
MHVQDIFLAAVEIADLQERVSYIATVCQGNEAMHRKVTALLAAHERSGGFLDIPVLQQMAGEQAQGDRRPVGEEMEEDIDLSFLEPSTSPGSLGRLLHYEVQDVIGRGGCGIVLKAFDAKLHRIVAIKIMTPQLAATSPARKRFLREARATAAIRHENVVSIYAVEEKPLPFLVMEYIDGLTLQDKIAQTGPLELPAVLSIGQQIALGLEVAHEKGLVHRDIKPANILLERGNDRVKITDFGLARSADDASLTQSGAISGTPLYMSPEQAQGLKIDHRSDLFSLGSVLYVMCTGRPPFRAASAVAVLKRVVEEQPRPILEIIPETPEWLVSIIAKLHSKVPMERFSAAHQVVEALEHRPTELGRSSQGGHSVDGTRMKDSVQKMGRVESLVYCLTGQLTHLSRRPWSIASVVTLTLLAGLVIGNVSGFVNVRPPSHEEMLSTRGQNTAQISGQSDSVLAAANHEVDPIVGKWGMQMGPWPYTAELRADGSGEGRFHSDVLTAIKNKNSDGGPPETFPMRWTRISHETYAITGLEVTLSDILLKGDRLSHSHWLLPAERLSQQTTVVAFADADRKAAEYVLSIGGKVQINEIPKDLTSLQELPQDDFRLTSAKLLSNSNVTEAGLQNFAGTAHLRHVELSGVSQLTDASLAHFRQNRQLSFLGLAFTKINGRGFRFLHDCAELQVLWLNSSHVDDEGMAEIAKLKGVSLLGLIDCPVSDRGMDHFGNHANLRQVEIPGTKITDETLKTALTWPKIGRLHVDRTEITDAGLAILKNCNTLDELALSSTRISDEGLRELSSIVSLKKLNLVRTRSSEAGVKELAAQLRNCRIAWNGGVIEPSSSADFLAASYVLSVGGSIQVNGQETVIRSSSRFPSGPFQITGVNLKACSKASDEGLSVFSDCIGVVSLDISQTLIRNHGLGHFRKCRHLKSLICDNSKVIGPVLANFEECQHLEELGLCNIPLHLNDFVSVADRHYRRLNLGSTGITNNWFSRFTNLSDLEFLSIHSTEIGNEGLSHLRHSRKLAYLNLRNTKTTDAGLAHLTNCFELREVILSETTVTDEGLESLLAFKNMRRLELEKTKITATGVEKLRRSLPQCRIIWDGGVIEPGKL